MVRSHVLYDQTILVKVIVPNLFHDQGFLTEMIVLVLAHNRRFLNEVDIGGALSASQRTVIFAKIGGRIGLVDDMVGPNLGMLNKPFRFIYGGVDRTLKLGHTLGGSIELRVMIGIATWA
ncbi:unnamed protein product [Lupinus luteus]|uniref:Uncharacterized protein n=1 Tax=Lupinus luteus TaxID=3873 RepID=A0AAV1WZU6_LUPLU